MELRRFSHTLDRSPLIVLAAAIFDPAGRVLLARRRPGMSNAGLWEFPGGKLEAHESAEDGLRREIAEELGLEIDVVEYIATGYSETERHTIELRGYRARLVAGDLRLSDHDAVAWVTLDALDHYPLPAADRPIAAALQGTGV